MKSQVLLSIVILISVIIFSYVYGVTNRYVAISNGTSGGSLVDTWTGDIYSPNSFSNLSKIRKDSQQ